MSNILRSQGNRLNPPKIQEPKREKSSTIVFDQSKRESFTLINGFRQLHKYLRNQWTVQTNNDEIMDATFEKVQIFVLPLPRQKFYEQEIDALRNFINSGGSLLVLMSEGGEQKSETNINFLLEEFGIACNTDAVIRTVYYKYFDPKEALVSNGVLNRAIATAAGKQMKIMDENNNNQALSFVYPYGSTLSVNRESVAILSTGTVCYPINRPVCAFHTTQSGGKIAVVGSVHMFTDQYIDKEENSKIWDVIIKYLSEGIELNPIDAADPDLADMHPIPDHIFMSNQLKMCLQESEVEQTIFGDFTKLFDASLQSIDLDLWPQTIKAYEKLGFKHEPLTLVGPSFEVPLPPLMPAVFPPNFREIPPPQLELFDLDDAFSSAESRMAQLANRCSENDLEHFIKEVGELLLINRNLPSNERNAKRVLEHILHQEEEDNNYMHENVQIFHDVEEANYFDDLDEYDDLDQ
uniref:Uncharacterized protein n=1 Tax=Acrobeloides nanus TaxID=290746 RepID=A0A914EKJ8_9BILA